MILVDATNHPGPALWQGIMLCLMPVWFWATCIRDGAYLKPASIAYAAVGVALFLWITAA